MLENIQTGAYNLLTNTRFWMILVVVIFFLIVAGYVYNKYVTPMVDAKFIPNNEFHGEGTVGGSTTDAIQEVELYIFRGRSRDFVV